MRENRLFTSLTAAGKPQFAPAGFCKGDADCVAQEKRTARCAEKSVAQSCRFFILEQAKRGRTRSKAVKTSPEVWRNISFHIFNKADTIRGGRAEKREGSGFLWPIAKGGAAFRAFLWFFCMPAEGRRRLQSCKKQYIIETRENGERQLYGFRDF